MANKKPKYKIGDTLIRTHDRATDSGHVITVGNIVIKNASDIYYTDINNPYLLHHELVLELHQPTKRNISIKDIQEICIDLYIKGTLDNAKKQISTRDEIIDLVKTRINLFKETN